MTWNEVDRTMMRRALDLARRGLGAAAPNPAVGCVLVSNGVVVGEGWTQPGGRPHAETVALAAAGHAALGATAYVTLEPCSHFGKTPPCADALIGAGVARVIVAVGVDPDPRVDGRGIARLRSAGITVDCGLLESEATALNAGFFSRLRRGRPWITLKLSTTLEGRLGTAEGERTRSMALDSHHVVHQLRADHDAVMIGSGTVLADDPRLACHLDGLADRPVVRIIVDGRLRTPLDSQLVRSAAERHLWIVTADDQSAERIALYREQRVIVLTCPRDHSGRLNLTSVLQCLGERGVNRVLVEGGATLAGALIRAGLVDHLIWHRTPLLRESDALPVVGFVGLGALSSLPGLVSIDRKEAGGELLETYILNTSPKAQVSEPAPLSTLESGTDLR